MYFTFITVREDKLKIEVGWRKIKQSKKFTASPPPPPPPPPPPLMDCIFFASPPPFSLDIFQSPAPLLPSPFRQPNLTRNKTKVSFISGE